MRLFFMLLFCTFMLAAFGQTHKCVSLHATGHFNFGTSGLGADDAGLGLALDASFFSKYKLQAVVETTYDRFFGDKVLYVDAAEKELKDPSIYSLKLGAQYWLLKNLALSAAFGPAWHRMHETAFTTGYGFRFSTTERLGKQQRFILKAGITTLSKTVAPVRYFTFGAGYRFL